MSGENKLEFSTGVGNDTLEPHLQSLLTLSRQLQAALHLKLDLKEQGVTLAQLTSMKQTLQELHTLSHLQVTLGGDSRVKGGKGTGNAYVEMQAVLAELKALAASTRIQSALANEKNLRLQQQAFSTGSTKDFNKLDPEQRKYFKLGLEQAQKAGRLSDEKIALLKELNQLDKQAVIDKKRLSRAERDESFNANQTLKERLAAFKERKAERAKAAKIIESDTNFNANQTLKERLAAFKERKAERAKAAKIAETKAKKAQTIANNVLLAGREKARTGQIVSADIKSSTDANLLKAYGRGFKDTAYDNRVSPTERVNALAMQKLVEERLRAFSNKPLDWTAETNRRIREQTNIQGELNPKARPALLSRAERTFDTRIATEEHTQALLKHRQSLTAANIATLTNAAELTRANQAVKAHSKAFPEQSIANQSLLEAIKERTKQLKHQRKLETDPNFAASERLKLEQANLRTGSVDSRSKGQALADERAQKKVAEELGKRKAIMEGIYHTEEKIKALRPEEIKHARDTLNYQYAMSGNDKVKREQATQMLRLLADAETAHRKALSTSGLIVDLERTHYKTKESLRNLSREELQQAVQVLSYRTKIAATEAQRAAAQHLLNSANQNLRLNPEAQTDNRAAHRDRILGDAGASLLTIQAGLMLNYKLLGGFQSLFSSAIDSAIKLDSAFRQLQAISAATNYEMATMKINLIDVAQASKFSASEVGETAVLLAQAGLSIQEISASMKGIITLAQATGTDLSKSVDVVTSVLSVFNKSAGETNQIVNQLTQALNSSKLDIQKVALGIQYAGNISADAGVSFEELTSALGAMANAGIRSGSTLGTGFRQMLLDLERPSTKLKARLDGLGLSFNEIDFRAYGLAGVLKNLREAGFTTADAFKTFEVRSAAAFSALSGNLDDFDRLQEELVDTNAAFEANHVQLEALAVQLDHLKSNLGIVMAEGLKPMTALTRDVAKGLAHMMENSEQGSSTLRVLGTTMASITAGVAIAWLARLTYEFGKMTKAAMVAREAVFFLTPAGRVGAAAAALIGYGAFSAYSNELERMTTELDTAKGKFNEAKEVFASSEQNISNIETAIKKLIDRYGVLSASQSETTKEADSLKKQFEELGLQIEDTANIKVPQLLAALRTLRAEQTEVNLRDLYNKSDKEQDKLWKDRDAAFLLLNSRDNADTIAKARALGGFSAGQGVGAAPLNSRGVPITPAYQYGKGLDLAKGVPSSVTAGIAQMVSALETFKTTNTLPKDLNLAQSMYNMNNTLRTSGLEPQKVAKVRAVLEELEKLLQAAESVVKYPERSAKAESAARRTEYSLKTAQLALGPTKALGQSQDIDAAYKIQLQKIDASKMSKTRKDYEAAKAASRAKFDVELNAAATQKEIDKIHPETTDENLRNMLNGLQDQLAAIKAISGSYDGVIQRMKEIGDKALEVKLKGELRALEEQLTELKKLWGDADSDPALESLRPKIAKKHQEVQHKRRQIANLKGEDLPSRAIEQGSETRQLGQVFSAQEEKVQDLQNKAVQNYKDFQRNKELENYEKAQTEWLETFRKGEESWSEIKKAEYKRLGLSANSSLSEGEMFGQVNKDLRARAQQIANATGVSQEYTQYGKGVGGFFAKQAAKRQQGALKLKEAQEKLARGLVTQDTLNPKIAEEQVAIKDLMEKKLSAQTQLENTMFMRQFGFFSDEDLAKEQELAEKDLSSIDKLLQSHQGFLNDFTKLRDDAKTDIEASLVYLQEGILKPEDELIKSLRAGQEALSSGLSSFMGDWASDMIQNTEDVKDAFESMGKAILQSMLKVITDRTATMFTNMLLGDSSKAGDFGILGNLFGGLAGGSGETAVDGAIAAYSPLDRMSHGGVIKGYAGGGFVSGTDIGHDIVPAMLRPDEYVLQPTATKALGTGFLDRLNSVTTGGLKQLEGKGTAPQINLQKSPPVNVYVVSPDQQRQMGSEDVVVAIQDNIMRNGSIKQLIKSVVVGEI